jgi:hypothetical protein
MNLILGNLNGKKHPTFISINACLEIRTHLEFKSLFNYVVSLSLYFFIAQLLYWVIQMIVDKYGNYVQKCMWQLCG